MDADLARHWIGLIRAQLPEDANVELLLYTRQAGIIFIDRPAPIEGRPNRRSRNARLYFPDQVIGQYLNEVQQEREKADARLADFIQRRVARMGWDHDEPRHTAVPGELFVMDRDVLLP